MKKTDNTEADLEAEVAVEVVTTAVVDNKVENNSQRLIETSLVQYIQEQLTNGRIVLRILKVLTSREVISRKEEDVSFLMQVDLAAAVDMAAAMEFF